jgi:23S rRNA (guanine745-N1)-methyltransferase
VNLAVGSKAAGDTPGMVAAREEFLAAGHYAPVAAALAERAVPGLVVDVGGGTGYYLAAVLERTGGSGVVVEAAAVGADAWRGLPFADASADLVTTLFAPRAVAEVTRVLKPGGRWIVVTPLPEHLEEVRGPLGMVGVEERKAERLHEDLAGFGTVSEDELRVPRVLRPADLRALVLMGPSAHHVDPAELDRRLAGFPAGVPVTVAVRLTVVRRP